MAGAALTGNDPLGRRMREGRGRERRVIAVTRVTRQIRRDMVGRFGRGRTALDVAGGATARAHAGMIETGAGEGGITLVAGIARGRGGDVTRCFAERVPLGVGTVVAGTALAGNNPLGRRMCEGRGCERATRGVAGIA